MLTADASRPFDAEQEKAARSAVFRALAPVLVREGGHGGRPGSRLRPDGWEALPPSDTTSSLPHEQETERVRRLFNALAPTYDWEIVLWEKILYRDCRRWVCSQAVGDVLEIAVGTGRNMPFYPPAIRLTGIDLSEAMLARARRRARALNRQAQLHLGDAQALKFPDRSFDTVVLGLALCAIPDPRLALAQARRVLKPGGRLLLFEHARSSSRCVCLAQRFLAAFSLRLGRRYLLRDPLAYLADVGLEIECVERLALGVVQRARAVRRQSAGGECMGANPAPAATRV